MPDTGIGVPMWSFRKESENSSYSNTDPLFKQQELLNLSDLVTLNKLKFYFNYSDMLNITNQGANHTQIQWSQRWILEMDK